MSKEKSKVKGVQSQLDVGKTLKPLEQPATDVIQDSSFANLRQKIEGQFKSNKTGTGQKPVQKPSKKIIEGGDKQEPSRGTKRKHNGDSKPDSDAQRNKRNSTDDTTSLQEHKDLASDLKAIVAELGGTEEDLDLINGAQSDSEMEGEETQTARKTHLEPKKGKTLESGMANILKEIALVNNTYKDDESESEETVKVNGNADLARPQADDKVSRAIPRQDDLDNSRVQNLESRVQKGRQSRLKCTPRSDWYKYEHPTFDIDYEAKSPPSVQVMENLHAYARNLLQLENDAFRSTQVSTSSQSFYNTVISSGTLSDKISALTLAVQESPLHNMRGLENLVVLAGKRSRSQAVDVLRALKDLLAEGLLLPSDRRLYTFVTQPGLLAALRDVKTWREGDRLPHILTESLLIIWAFEDWLKGQYFEVLKILETWCNDEIEFAKTRATSYVYELLKEKPEQEANLLRLLVNKLGDPVKKISSQASYLIMQLLSSHPAMKEVVVAAIDTDFIFKPGQTLHARYYAVVTLNQTALSTKQENVAVRLLSIYFGLFKLLLKPGEEKEVAPPVSRSRHQRQRKQAAALPNTEQEDELKEKLVSAILTGVNRAYPYCGTGHQSFDVHLDTLFQITHSANFNTSIQAMLLIQQLISNTSTSSDRFYRTLYESLLDPRLASSSKQQLYLNLLHRSLKADISQKRVKAFVKRILQVLSLQDPSFVCAAFFLLKDLEKTIPSLTAMVDQPEDHEDDEEEVFKDVDEGAPATDAVQPGVEGEAKRYDANKRAPEHANADGTCLWEALPFLAHFHPSVSVSAEHILDHKPLPGKPDLTLHTMIHFLDRFVYKNAKLSASHMRGSSIMQPMANDDSRSVLVGSASGTRKLPINSEEFRSKKDGDIAADDVFFHKYFKNLGKSVTKKTKKVRHEDEESNVSDDEDEVWKAMMNNAPDLGGLDDEDDEISDGSAFEEAMQDDGDSLDEGEDDIDMTMNGEDDDESVDIEAGIFDDSEDGEDDGDAMAVEEEKSESEFEGLDSENEQKKAPSKKTLEQRKNREERKKMKALPTFASVADYAKMLDDDEDEDFA